MWKILIVVVFLFQTSVLMGDDQTNQSENTETATVAAEGQTVVVITDPEITAEEDEEPDCE